MCVISGCECLYTPPSRNNLTIWGILELIIMAICGLLCASDLIELFNSDAHHRTSIVLILVVVADVFIVLGLCLIIFGLFCSPSQSQIRSGITINDRAIWIELLQYKLKFLTKITM